MANDNIRFANTTTNFTILSEGAFVLTSCTLWVVFEDCFAKIHGQPTDFKRATCGPRPSLLFVLWFEQVFLGRPLFLLSRGIHSIISFGILSSGILLTWPYHCRLFFSMLSMMSGFPFRGCPRKTWMEGVEAAVTTRNLESDQWRNREEWRLVSWRQRQLLKIPDR
jgi:hypothetical protein